MRKNICWSLLTILLVMFMSVCIVSCGDDDEKEDGLVGWYQSTPYHDSDTGVDYFKAIHIINSNTMWIYYSLANKKTKLYSNSFSEHSGWYVSVESDGGRMATFTRSHNKIVTTDGTIYTIFGNQLVKEGGDKYDTFTKL